MTALEHKDTKQQRQQSARPEREQQMTSRNDEEQSWRKQVEVLFDRQRPRRREPMRPDAVRGDHEEILREGQIGPGRKLRPGIHPFGRSEQAHAKEHHDDAEEIDWQGAARAANVEHGEKIRAVHLFKDQASDEKSAQDEEHFHRDPAALQGDHAMRNLGEVMGRHDH